MTDTEKSLDDVLRRDRVMYAELYCENPSCPVREHVVHFKDYVQSARWLLKEAGGVFTCCLCVRPLKVHWFATRAEYDARCEREARQSVNYQILKHPQFRASGGQRRSILVSLAEMSDDSLPGFPDESAGE